MNRIELINTIKQSPIMQLKHAHDFRKQDEKQFICTFEQEYGMISNNSLEKFIYYAKEFANITFSRKEIISGDNLIINLELLYAFCLDRKNFIVAQVGHISSCCSIIESFWLSNDGRFSCDSQFHEASIIANNIDEFIEYLLTKEYDYHISVTENTYKKLHDAGWYEGRRIDISDIIKICRLNHIVLSPQQKNFLSEFAGIYSPDIYSDDGFFISKTQIYDNWDLFFRNSKVTDFPKSNYISIQVGLYYGCMCDIYITPRGLLSDSGLEPYIGRTVMEGWELILNH